MSQERARRELSQARSITRLTNLVIALVGVIAAVVYFVAKGDPDQRWYLELLFLIATTCVSVAGVSLVLSRATLVEQQMATRVTLDDAIDKALAPLREAISDDGQRDYRWHCLLGLPDQEDEWPQYAVQRVEISKRISHIPPVIRVVALASDNDAVLDEFSSGDYAARWLVDEGLPVDNDRVFAMTTMSINGIQLSPEVSSSVTPCRSRVFKYVVPEAIRESHDFLLRVGFRTLKHVAHEERISVDTQVFQHTMQSEFRCTIDRSIRPVKFIGSASEVSYLGPKQDPGVLQVDPGAEPGPWSLVARFDTPISAGSSVSFRIERDASGEDERLGRG